MAHGRLTARKDEHTGRWRNWIKQGDAVDPATSDTGSNPVLSTKNNSRLQNNTRVVVSENVVHRYMGVRSRLSTDCVQIIKRLTSIHK